MAMILKTNKTYTYKGLNVPNPYLVIDYCNGSKAPNQKTQHFTVHIYTSQADRNNPDNIIYSKDYDVSGEYWDLYFSPEKVDEYGDQYASAYEYIKQVIDENGELVYNDFKDLI